MNQSGDFLKRQWRMWGPVIIKTVIAWGVWFVAEIFLISLKLAVSTGGDIEALRKISNSAVEMKKISDAVAQQIMGLAVSVEGIAALATIPIMAVLFYMDIRRDRKSGIKREKRSWGALICAPVLCVIVAMIVNNLIIAGNLSSISETYQQTMEMFYKPSLWIQLICLGIVIPICEELVFRGLVFMRIRRDLSFARAAIYSSLIFGVVHGNLVQMIYGMFMGLVLSFVYEQSKTLAAPILGHMAANVFSVLATYYDLYERIAGDILLLGIITVAGAFLSSTMVVLLRGQQEEITGEKCD